jgi:hypothetical protein
VDNAPQLPRELPLATNFGPPVPQLSDERETSGDIELVTPLPPSPPVALTGRSLVLPERRVIGEETPPGAAPADPAEMPWVTVASYFPVSAQRDAMAAAKYAPYRSKVYVVGVDVQRQEMQANGEFSEWQAVPRSSIMPRIDIPDPQFDEQTGAIVNKGEIDRAYDLVRAYQPDLIQPDFYYVVRGDAWRLPPLEGYGQADTRLVAADEAQPRRARDADEDDDDVLVALGDDDDEEDDAPTGRDTARRDLEAAERAYRNGEDDAARTAAQRVLANRDANRRDEQRARQILRSIRQLETQAALRTPEDEDGRGEEADSPIITHPDDPTRVAVWYHDDSVESGKTYRYRMRVKLWNRYWGKLSALQDPDQAKQTVLVGDWSLPGEAITVTPGTYFFLTRASIDKTSAGVEVYKWLRGRWLKESFDIAVGDVVGGIKEVATGVLDRQTLEEVRQPIDFTTGAVVLDLEFDAPVYDRDRAGRKGEFKLRETDSLVMVYLDPADGQVKRRAQVFDKRAPLKDELERKTRQ